MSYTQVNYVIEVRRPNMDWLTIYNAADNETAGRDAFSSWQASSQSAARGGVLEIRLVRRTAVITDEVLETTTGGPDETATRHA